MPEPFPVAEGITLKAEKREEEEIASELFTVEGKMFLWAPDGSSLIESSRLRLCSGDPEQGFTPMLEVHVSNALSEPQTIDLLVEKNGRTFFADSVTLQPGSRIWSIKIEAINASGLCNFTFYADGCQIGNIVLPIEEGISEEAQAWLEKNAA